MAPIRVCRWRSPEITCIFITRTRQDREALATSTASFMLTLWGLAERPFCFRAKEGLLHVGLAETRSPTPR